MLDVSGTSVVEGTPVPVSDTSGVSYVAISASETRAMCVYKNGSPGYLDAVIFDLKAGSALTANLPATVNKVASAYCDLAKINGNEFVFSISGTSTYLQAGVIDVGVSL
ncbi:hypothetical protein [Candidatus Methylobacter oryzae]|uniref:Uncharacterized protein n=1 Tax=Candidatus Methylobacter oryzae TaxID=2497749 RepID=A0ABY3C8G3_9GAMM|nr:hypothetical protein [Candidatus Methylobacter oryzae]TRW92805.1 hypothetical protein EKO24_014490 [Candidatus Methylobacter oryzae]